MDGEQKFLVRLETPDSTMTDSNAPLLLPTLRLAHAKNVGPVTFRKLVRVFGSAEAALAAPRDRLLEVPDLSPRTADGIAEARNDPWANEEFDRAKAAGVKLIGIDDPLYPRALLTTYDPPIVLFVDGTLLPDDALSVGIVGSRHCSHYGRQQAEKLAAGLAAAGFTVVSGLARGIDSAAHVGALSVERGRTIAVLGNGIGTIYPPENKALYERIALGTPSRGAAICELPMGTPPAAQHFPARNRIIAGMTLGTLVVEGSEKSGSLITARYAVDMDREVFAVPGSVESPNSRGPHRLIKAGAKLVEDVDDILDELREIAEPLVKIRPPDQRLRIAEPKANKTRSDTPLLENLSNDAKPDAFDPGRPSTTDLRAINLNPREKTVYDLLDQNAARPIDEIIVKSGLKTQEVLATLMILEVRRLCKQLPGKRYLKA